MAENRSKYWLLTFEYFKKEVKKPEDNLIILMHWLLLKNNFQVLGPGDENIIDDNEQPSDFLPTNWSQDVPYKFRYVRDKKLFLLNGVKVGDDLILNFYNATIKQVSCTALEDISFTVQQISDLANNEDSFIEIISLLEKDLIDPMKQENDNMKAISTQTQESQQERSIPESALLISRTEPNRYVPNIPRNPFPSYGMPDLDPLADLRNPGGGMIFDPMQRGSGRSGFNPGYPQGARFDPMRPPNPDPMMPGGFRRPRPDNMAIPDFDDHLYKIV